MQHHAFEGTVTLMTDPICSWCWGTLPEILKVKAVLGDRLDFQLRCAGLQVGSAKPLSDEHKAQLLHLWRQVAETTGQQFAFELPTDATFIYHSELACRSLTIARQQLGTEPWDIFHAMQEAFYVHARNLGDLNNLFELLAPTDISLEEFEQAINDEEIVTLTRQEFAWCKDRAIQALPTVFLDTGNGPDLICGGYATAEYLIEDLNARLVTH